MAMDICPVQRFDGLSFLHEAGLRGTAVTVEDLLFRCDMVNISARQHLRGRDPVAFRICMEQLYYVTTDLLAVRGEKIAAKTPLSWRCKAIGPPILPNPIAATRREPMTAPRDVGFRRPI